jgi:hypothetical protein
LIQKNDDLLNSETDIEKIKGSYKVSLFFILILKIKLIQSSLNVLKKLNESNTKNSEGNTK